MAGTPKVALLGTGTMGVGMARSMLRAGLPVTVWNRHPERAQPLADAGATVARSVEDAVREADVVVTMLFDEPAVTHVMAQAAGRMKPDAVWMQSSTVGLRGPAALGAFADEHALRMLDAPVLGTKQPAEEGTLVVLASGAESARSVAQPVFDAIGAKTVWVGPEIGAASALKLVANAWVATLTAGTAQGIQLTRGLGLDPQLFLDTIGGGASDSPYLQTKGEAILEGRLDAQFALDGLLKDLRLIREAAVAGRVPTTLIDALLAAFASASEEGHGDEDIAAVAASFAPVEE